MLQGGDEFFDGVVRCEVVIVHRAFSAHLYNARILKDLQMMRYCRSGQMRKLGDLRHPHSIAVLAVRHHLEDQVLPYLVTKCGQDFLAGFKFISQFLDF